MQTLRIAADATAALVSRTLADSYPGVVFSIRMASDGAGRRDLRGIDVVWVDGPRREEVEALLDRFQGISWDPRTGALESRSHYQVGSDGQLEEVFYDVDYVFCDGPTTVLF